MKRTILILTAITFALSSVLTSCGKDDGKKDDDKTINVAGITLSKTTLSLGVGEEVVLTTTISPSDASDKSVTWTSSNTSIATVDNNGKITGKVAGKTEISVKTNSGNHIAKCEVVVMPAEGAIVFFGTEQWVVSASLLLDLGSMGYDLIVGQLYKSESSYYPSIYTEIPNKVGTYDEKEANFEYYEKTRLISISQQTGDTTYYGDWWTESGSTNLTNYSNQKLSGIIDLVMLDALDYAVNGNKDAERRTLKIYFNNLTVINPVEGTILPAFTNMNKNRSRNINMKNIQVLNRK